MSNLIEKTEKKISRIIKWLERCAVACRSGSCDSALMDIECARVDFDKARDEIWAASQKKYAPSVSNHRVGAVAFTAVLVLFFTAAPLSVLEKEYKNVEANLIEWVTPDEKMLLANLRVRFTEANLTSGGTLTQTDPPTKEERRRTQQQNALRPSVDSSSLAQSQEERAKKDDLRIFNLVKTGERALRNEQIMVKIEK